MSDIETNSALLRAFDDFSPYDRGYRDEQAGIGWYSNPYPENTVEFRRWVDGKVQAIIDERTKHEG